MKTRAYRDLWTWAMALVGVGFGVLTIKEGGTVLFGGEEARAAAGAYIPFVLWFNFIAGFFYVVAGVGLWLQHRWAVWLAACIAVATLAVLVAFAVHVGAGGAYEKRTLVAMILRSAVWLAIAAMGAWRFRRRRITDADTTGHTSGQRK